MKNLFVTLMAMGILVACSMSPKCGVFAKIKSSKHFKCDAPIMAVSLRSSSDIVCFERDGRGFVYAGNLASSMEVSENVKEMMSDGGVREICFVVCNKGVVDGIYYTPPFPNGDANIVAGKGGGNVTVMPSGEGVVQVFKINSPVKVFMLKKDNTVEDGIAYFIDISDDPRWGDVVACIDEIVDIGGVYVFKK